MATQPQAQEEAAAKPPEPLKYKMWVLKVSVHCEGCKRKVKKILHAIEGVYIVDVDAKLHKVTVTGNVDSGTLIRKLEKSGKHAELWPEKKEQEGKTNKKKKGKQDDQNDPGSSKNNSSAPAEKEKPDSTKDDASGPSSKAVEGVNTSKTGSDVQNKGAKVEQKKPPAENPQSPESGPAGDVAAGGNDGEGGGGGKKKKKKGNKGNNGDGNGNGNSNQGQPAINNGDENSNGNSNGEAAHTQAARDGQEVVKGKAGAKGKAAANGSTPGGFPMSERPQCYYGPPPAAAPVYAVSYNTSYPSGNYTASYYASPPPYTYAYVHQGSEGGPVPSDWNNSGAPQPSDSFEMFSDENPNACCVM